MSKDGSISASVIKRLPRYYRFLGELQKEGLERISSRELSERMKLTAYFYKTSPLNLYINNVILDTL